MTVHVALLGIDGSGKSSLAASLATVLAGERGLVVGSAVADDFWVRARDEDLCAPGFHTRGYAIAARLERFLRALSRVAVDNKVLYPPIKVFQMLVQDNAAVKLAGRYAADVMISDGNMLLSGAGRAFNYRGSPESPATIDDIALAFDHLLARRPLPPESRRRLPGLRVARILAAVARATRLRGIWLPDLVLFLDLEPERAIQRIEQRGGKIDRHENLHDLATARRGYLGVMEVVRRRSGDRAVATLSVGSMSPGEVLAAAVEVVQRAIPHNHSGGCGRAGALHEPEGGEAATRRVLTPAYLFKYLLPRLLDSGWREPFFPLSGAGRTFMREGYSAEVMRLIYDQPRSAGPFARAFFGYPLHRAVRDRLAILERHVERELRARLARGPVTVFSAPCGVAYDVLRPLRRIAKDGISLSGVRLVAADLDPAGLIRPRLEEAARDLGIELRFHRGDLTSTGLRDVMRQDGPFDLALFIGLSAWLPKSVALDHLRWLSTCLTIDGALLVDSFTTAGYAAGGAVMGYRATYYPPVVLRALADYCGFDGLAATIESGPDAINHVLVARRRPLTLQRSSSAA